MRFPLYTQLSALLGVDWSAHDWLSIAQKWGPIAIWGIIAAAVLRSTTRTYIRVRDAQRDSVYPHSNNNSSNSKRVLATVVDDFPNGRSYTSYRRI